MSSVSRPRSADKAPSGEGAPMPAYSLADELSAADKQYLADLARDTWACIDALAHPATAMPYDSNDFSITRTSVTNIGMYAAALVAAVEMGFLPRAEAVAKAAKLIESVEKLKSWNGFCQSWNEVDTLKPSPQDTWISILDTGNMVG